MKTQRKKWPWERSGVCAGMARPRMWPPQTLDKQRRLLVSSWPPRDFGLVAPGRRECTSVAAGHPVLVLCAQSPGGSDNWGGLARPAGRGSGALLGSCVPKGASWLPGEKPAGLPFPFCLSRSPWNRRKAPLSVPPGTLLPEAGRLTLIALSSNQPSPTPPQPWGVYSILVLADLLPPG